MMSSSRMRSSSWRKRMGNLIMQQADQDPPRPATCGKTSSSECDDDTVSSSARSEEELLEEAQCNDCGLLSAIGNWRMARIEKRSGART